MDDFFIEPAKTMSDMQMIANIQRKAWEMEDIGIVPTFEMKAMSDIGIVLVAKDKNGIGIGFIYAMPQFPNSYYSHMMGVVPEWQGKGVGFALKKYHRNLALASPYNIQSINWTVDPLLPNNAYINFAKLGVECNTYYIDYYGEPSGDGVGIYSGVPTDRFLVNWKIREQKVERRLLDYKIDRVDRLKLMNRSPSINKIVENEWIDLNIDIENSFTVMMPPNYQEIRNNNVDLAIDWRLKFRKLCVDYFKNGYKAYDYHSFEENGIRINYYEFIKG